MRRNFIDDRANKVAGLPFMGSALVASTTGLGRAEPRLDLLLCNVVVVRETSNVPISSVHRIVGVGAAVATGLACFIFPFLR